MISDTLSDAIQSIQEYLSNEIFDDVYAGETRLSILRVKAEMEKLRIELDNPKASPHQARYEALRLQASERYAEPSDNGIEIPGDAYVSISDEDKPDGAFVEALVWVRIEHDEHNEDDKEIES